MLEPRAIAKLPTADLEKAEADALVGSARVPIELVQGRRICPGKLVIIGRAEPWLQPTLCAKVDRSTPQVPYAREIFTVSLSPEAPPTHETFTQLSSSPPSEPEAPHARETFTQPSPPPAPPEPPPEPSIVPGDAGYGARQRRTAAYFPARPQPHGVL